MSNDRNDSSSTPSDPGRRRFIKLTGGAVAGATLLAGSTLSTTATAAPRTIRLGYVTPHTGPLAPFSAADTFVIKHMRERFKNGIKINGVKHPVEILVKDSQSNPNRAATVASSLILDDHIDMMLVASTPITTNPVSDQCEVNGVPCVATVVPWQDWFYSRGGKKNHGFKYTYCFFWGVEDVVAVYTSMWRTLKTNKVVGGLWPNDVDGNYWGGNLFGFPPALKKEGYKLIDPGRYTDLAKDFSAQIAEFKKNDVEILTGVPIPPDFTTFWSQAAQQGFHPKIATIGKALLFPSSVNQLGARGNNLSCEYWWSPSYPFKSSLTGQSAAQLAKSWEQGTHQQWTQPLGFSHALFEVAVHALQHAHDIDKPDSISAALAATKLNTIVGPLDWTHGPVPNVAKTPLAGGQWRKQPAHAKYPFELLVVDNSIAPEIPVQSHLEPLTS